MALAAVTSSTNGGPVQEQPNGATSSPATVAGAVLRWARGATTAQSERHGREEVLEAVGLKHQYYPAGRIVGLLGFPIL